MVLGRVERALARAALRAARTFDKDPALKVRHAAGSA